MRSVLCACAVCYGLTKVHKSDYPVRPIISTIGTYNYSTAKYLGKILESYFNTPLSSEVNVENPNNILWKPQKRSFKYALKDTFDFLNKLGNVKLEEGDYIITVDVVSLFTNVPIDETIELIKKAFFKKNAFFRKKTK